MDMVWTSLFIGYIFCKNNALSVSLLPDCTSRVDFHSADSFLIRDLPVRCPGVSRGLVLGLEGTRTGVSRGLVLQPLEGDPVMLWLQAAFFSRYDKGPCSWD